MKQLLLNMVGYPHELCHYLAAKLLGCDVELYADHVLIAELSSAPFWQNFIITLAPFFAGVFVFSSLALLDVYRNEIGHALFGIAGMVAWTYTCLDDFISLKR